MVRQSTVFLIIATIVLLEHLSAWAAGSFATSVIPGWHTTIYPPYFFVCVLQAIWICILPLIYFFRERRRAPIHFKVFAFHVAATLTFFLSANALGTFADLYFGVWVVLPALVLFAMGQLVFLVALISRNHN